MPEYANTRMRECGNRLEFLFRVFSYSRILVFFFFLLAFSHSRIPVFAAELPPITEFTLKNGMQVVLIEDHRIPAVSHNLLFRVGAADDPRGKSGLAHYLEHMLFQGTATYGPNEYNRLIANEGGQANAFTSADYTGYWVNIAKDHLPLVLKLEADRLRHLAPTPKNFDREKQVILEERRMRVDNNPEGLFAEQVNAVLFYHHPYGTPIIGWQQEMEALDRETVMQYYHEYYHPKNAVLVLAGDFEPKATRSLLETAYGSIPTTDKKPAPRLEEPPQLAARRVTMRHAQVKQAQWAKVYVTPSYSDRAVIPAKAEPERSGDSRRQTSGETHQTPACAGVTAEGKCLEKGEDAFLPLMIAEHLLGGSKTSRLYRRLVEEDRLATDVSVSFNPFVLGPGQFDIGATPVSEAMLPKLEAAVAEELAKLQKTPPSTDELTRAKTRLLADNVYLQDGLQSLAQVMGHLKMIGLPLDYYFTWDEKAKAVTAEQVSEALKMLEENHSVTGELLPEKPSVSK